MSDLNYLPVSEAAALQIINSTTVFEEYLRAEKDAAQVRGGMYWKKQGQYEYLVRTSVDNHQARIGPRSPETEKIFDGFMARKVAVEKRLGSLGEALNEAQRMNRAQRAGRVPNLVVGLLNRLHQEGMDKHFTVVGTHALYAYESSAGVRIRPAALATQDVDMLWDARKRVSFITDLAKTDDKSILRILQRVDPTFQRKEMHNETAINDRGFEVDFLRREQQLEDPHPMRFSDDEGDLWPVQARRAGILTEAPRFVAPVIAQNGEMAMMSTISPTAFVKFKNWLATDAPERLNIKKSRDMMQAEIVQQMLDEGILFEQGVPPMAAEQGAQVSEREIRSTLEQQGYKVIDKSGPDGLRFIGPVVAVSEMHVAQDVGRRKIVIHDTKSLTVPPALGDRIEVFFKSGRGMVSRMDEPNKERGR